MVTWRRSYRDSRLLGRLDDLFQLCPEQVSLLPLILFSPSSSKAMQPCAVSISVYSAVMFLSSSPEHRFLRSTARSDRVFDGVGLVVD